MRDRTHWNGHIFTRYVLLKFWNVKDQSTPEYGIIGLCSCQRCFMYTEGGYLGVRIGHSTMMKTTHYCLLYIYTVLFFAHCCGCLSRTVSSCCFFWHIFMCKRFNCGSHGLVYHCLYCCTHTLPLYCVNIGTMCCLQ